MSIKLHIHRLIIWHALCISVCNGVFSTLRSNTPVSPAHRRVVVCGRLLCVARDSDHRSTMNCVKAVRDYITKMITGAPSSATASPTRVAKHTVRARAFVWMRAILW